MTSKFKDIIKNKSQIFEGIKNTIFKRDAVELIANERWKQCKKCALVDFIGNKCVAPGTQPCCSECGCSLSFKIRALSASCPHPDGPKWGAVMTEEEESKLNIDGE